MSHTAALADLRVARLGAWSEAGHPHPERALFEDVHREAARQRAPTSAEKRAVAVMLEENEGLVKLHTRGYVRARPELADDIHQEARILISAQNKIYQASLNARSELARSTRTPMATRSTRLHGTPRTREETQSARAALIADSAEATARLRLKLCTHRARNIQPGSRSRMIADCGWITKER